MLDYASSQTNTDYINSNDVKVTTVIIAGDGDKGKTVTAENTVRTITSDCYNYCLNNPDFKDAGCNVRKELLPYFVSIDVDLAHLDLDNPNAEPKIEYIAGAKTIRMGNSEKLESIMQKEIEYTARERKNKNITFLLTFQGGLPPSTDIFADLYFVFADRKDKTITSIMGTHKKHYNKYCSSVFDIKNYKDNQRSTLEELAKKEPLKDNYCYFLHKDKSLFDKEKDSIKTLIQLFMISEIKSYLMINNAQSLTDFFVHHYNKVSENENLSAELEISSLDEILLKKTKAVSKEFFDQTMNTVKSVDYDNSEKIEALLELGFSTKIIKKYLGDFDKKNLIVKNIFRLHEKEQTYEESPFLIRFLLEEFHKDNMTKLSKVIQNRNYSSQLLSKIIIYLKSVIETNNNSNSNAYYEENNYALITTQNDPEKKYQDFKSNLVNIIKQDGEIAYKYSNNIVNLSLMSYLEKSIKGRTMINTILKLRNKFDPKFLIMSGRVEEKYKPDCEEDRVSTIEHIKTKLGFSAFDLGEIEYCEEIRRLSKISSSYWHKALPIINNLFKQKQTYLTNLKDLVENREESKFFNKIFNVFKSKKNQTNSSNNNLDDEQTKQEMIDEAKKRIKQTDEQIIAMNRVLGSDKFAELLKTTDQDEFKGLFFELNKQIDSDVLRELYLEVKKQIDPKEVERTFSELPFTNIFRRFLSKILFFSNNKDKDYESLSDLYSIILDDYKENPREHGIRLLDHYKTSLEKLILSSQEKVVHIDFTKPSSNKRSSIAL